MRDHFCEFFFLLVADTDPFRRSAKAGTVKLDGVVFQNITRSNPFESPLNFDSVRNPNKKGFFLQKKKEPGTEMLRSEFGLARP